MMSERTSDERARRRPGGDMAVLVLSHPEIAEQWGVGAVDGGLTGADIAWRVIWEWLDANPHLIPEKWGPRQLHDLSDIAWGVDPGDTLVWDGKRWVTERTWRARTAFLSGGST